MSKTKVICFSKKRQSLQSDVTAGICGKILGIVGGFKIDIWHPYLKNN